jgi:hypothetical protein
MVESHRNALQRIRWGNNGSFALPRGWICVLLHGAGVVWLKLLIIVIIAFSLNREKWARMRCRIGNRL